MSEHTKTLKIRMPDSPPAPPVAAPARARTSGPLPMRLLVVNDDLAIRLKLADVLQPHAPGAVIDSCTQKAALELTARLNDYDAVVAILDLSAGQADDPLAFVAAVRAVARSVAVTVIGRGGDERSAVQALRAGAIDYWSLHNVDPADLVGTIRAQFLGTTAAIAPSAGSIGPPIAGYRLVKELARSARATLYLASSNELDLSVALKVHRHLDRSEASDAEQERFLRECQLLSHLNHRAIADVFDFGVTDECHWLAMEYFPCGSLKARLQHPIAEPEAVAYALQVGAALQAIHRAGIVHRDLKPSNIMLRADDSLALIDFGLARPALTDSSVTSPNVRVGSPSYMAPEQVQGVAPDERCDLYSLGIVLYELLTGQLPFTGPSIGAVLEQHLRAPAPALAAPLARFQNVLDRLLAKKPEDRFDSADQFIEALTQAGAEPAAPER